MAFSQKQFKIVCQSNCTTEANLAVALIEKELFDSTLDLPIDGADPLRLLELMRLNKVAAFLPPALFSDTLNASQAMIATLDSMRLRAMAMNAVGLKEASTVTACLRSAGIEHMHFKGPLQQLALYGTAYRKPSGDIDLLINAADRQRATDVIVDAGYEIFDAHLATWWWRFLGELHLRNPKSGMVVDLHHDVQQAGLPRPKKGTAFLKRRAQVQRGTEVFDVPSAADMCIIAAISIAKALRAHEPCLSAVVDLRMAITRLAKDDRKVLADVLERSGMQETLSLGLRAVSAIFPDSPTAQHAPHPSISVFSGIDDHTLRQMIITPWVPDLNWPRNRHFIAELSGQRPARVLKERLRLIMSEGTRKLLDRNKSKDSSAS